MLSFQNLIVTVTQKEATTITIKNEKKKKKKWVSIQWLHRHENPCWYLGKNMCQQKDHGQISLLILSESKRIVNFLNSWKLSRFYDDFKENKS